MNKYLKMALKILGGILGLLIVVVGGYFIYAYAQYHRLPNDIKETINRPKVEQVELDKTYKMMTFNIGYGSYPPSFSFFMDGGQMSELIANKR